MGWPTPASRGFFRFGSMDENISREAGSPGPRKPDIDKNGVNNK